MACLFVFLTKTVKNEEEESFVCFFLSEEIEQTADPIFTSHLDSVNMPSESIFCKPFSWEILFLLLSVIAQFVCISKQLQWLLGTDKE